MYQILKGALPVEGRPGANLPDYDLKAMKDELIVKHGDQITDRDVISAALYPAVFDSHQEFRKKYGPVDKLDTKTFLVGPEIAEEFSVSLICLLSHILHLTGRGEI